MMTSEASISAVRFQKNISRILTYLVLCAMVIASLVPIVLVVTTSFKSPTEIGKILALPKGIHVQNYINAYGQIGRSFLNSLLTSLPAAVISALVGSITAFPLSQFRFKGDRVLYMVLMLGLFIPYQIVLIPLFQVIRSLGLYDTIVGLWLVHTAYGVSYCTFFMRNYFAIVPKSLRDAAYIDGCSTAGYYCRILMPLCRPGITALILLQFRSIWNDLLFGLSLTRSVNARPITVALSSFVGMTDVQYGPLMAATLISILPMATLFLVFQREFVEGMMSGGVKS